MLTTAKLKEYEEYHGYHDGFYIQKVKKGVNLTSGDEWTLIGNLHQDIRLVEKRLAAQSFTERLNSTLNTTCDNQSTINFLIELAKKEW